jgi:caspase domain-containing protein
MPGNNRSIAPPVFGEVLPGTPVVGNNRSVTPQVFDADPLPDKPAGENFLLLIAIDHYQKVTKLENPVLDATGLLNVLLRRYAFSPEKTDTVKDLRDTDSRYSDRKNYLFPIPVYDDKHIQCLYNEQAITSNIKKKINQLKGGMTKNDNLLVYYAGHGYTDSSLWYITPFDYDPINDNGISFTDFATIAGNKNEEERSCKNLFFILDSCFAGNALKGLVGQTDDSYSGMALTSTGGKEVASDGKRREGSPFSKVLIKILENNTAPVLDVRDLFSALRKEFTGINQTLQLGYLPQTFGTLSFGFPLKNPLGVFANSFVETVFDHLNFNVERDIIETQIDYTLNNEYIVLSSVCREDKFHKLMGNVCSRVLLDKVQLEIPVRSFDHIVCSEGDIWKSIARKWNISPAEEDLDEKVVDALYDKLLSDVVAPYSIGLFFENLSPSLTAGIKSFCEKMLISLHVKKQANRLSGDKFSPLFLFIFDIRSGDNLFAKGNFEITQTSCGKLCSPFILFNESKSTIALGQAETWFNKSSKKLSSNTYFSLNIDWVRQQFKQSHNVSMIEFILAAAQKTGLQVPEITQILFKSN